MDKEFSEEKVMYRQTFTEDSCLRRVQNEQAMNGCDCISNTVNKDGVQKIKEMVNKLRLANF